MATDKDGKDLVDQAQEPAEDDGYRKPNPQDNPRNIILKEIASTVAKKHEEDFKETFPSVDDEGTITPAAPEQPAASAESAPEHEPQEPAAEPVAETVASPAPAALPQDVVDPEKDYTVTVDGQKMTVKGKAIIDAGYRTFQKETAARS